METLIQAITQVTIYTVGIGTMALLLLIIGNKELRNILETFMVIMRELRNMLKVRLPECLLIIQINACIIMVMKILTKKKM